MDESARGISFDDQGFCNYCRDAVDVIFENRSSVGKGSSRELINEIKSAGLGKPYDSIVGVSGGVDSSWVLFRAVELGLRPLAVHMDNTWNSELANSNIANLVTKLNVDLHTHVLEADNYDSLLRSMLNADVIDVELLYDNALHAVVYEQARKNSIKFILSGFNISTEGVKIPAGWSAGNKFDSKNIKGIARKSSVKIGVFPLYSMNRWVVDTFVRKIRWVPFLDIIGGYEKDSAELRLTSEVGYKPYMHKHYENTFTKIYQGLILPEKFGVDKRRPHLSALIVTDQMSRDAALEILKSSPLSEGPQARSEMSYFYRKLGISEENFADYLKRPEVSHDRYGHDFVISLARVRVLKWAADLLRNMVRRHAVGAKNRKPAASDRAQGS
jgi:hypothetical protein